MKTVDLNPHTILTHYILRNANYQHITNSAYITQNKKLNKDKQEEKKNPSQPYTTHVGYRTHRCIYRTNVAANRTCDACQY